MNEVALTEHTPEWHEHRSKYRNASEAGAVMGVDPYCTPYELWLRKKGLSTFEGNVATEYGHKHEARALELAEELMGVRLRKAVFTNGKYSASFDGYGENEKGDTFHVEIKCPYQRERSRLWKQSHDESDPIPKHYYWQMVHQSMVKPCTHRYLLIFIPAQGVEHEDFQLVNFWPRQGDDVILSEAWERFEENPPEPPTLDLSDDDILTDTVEDLKSVQLEMKNLAVREKELKEYLIRRAEVENRNLCIDGVTIQRVERKGNVDYSRIPELKGIDLDDYRKPSTLYWRVG